MSLLRDPKRLIALIAAGGAGLIILLDFVGVGGIVGAFAGVLINWAAIIMAIALLIGVLSVTGAHIGRIGRRDSDWIFSVLLLLGMIAVIFVGILLPLPGSSGLAFPGSLAESPIRSFFRVVYEPIASSLLALLAFFSISAALRALGRRNAEAYVIVGVAVLALLVQIPLVGSIPGLGLTLQWANDYIALAGARGLLIGSAIGALVAGMRVLLGFDSPYLDR
jgi:hypothetical protein